MDYKKTLNLPQTDFPMKANLPKREPSILEDWERMGLRGRIAGARKGAKKFILHDGPPYANGDIHIGHALNKILKDIIIKYKTMRGFDAPYVPGWDCHGLPVEHQLFKELGINKYEIDKVKFRKKAHRFAMKFVEIQKKQFKRLGVFGDWESPYLTLGTDYEMAILDCFQKFVKDGYIYRGFKPINWCVKCETALAEAEVEYDDHTSPSIYVKFPVIARPEGPKQSRRLRGTEGSEAISEITSAASQPRNDMLKNLLQPSRNDAYFLIWTTTPWTLAANVAIALHPDLEYAILECGGETLIMAEGLVAPTMEKAGLKCEIKAKVKGSELENLVCQHPFLDRRSKIVLADYVSNQEGTGCVHTAPGHGAEDYQTGLKYKLEVIMPVGPKGIFDKSAGDRLDGLHVFKANKKIVEMLDEKGLLFWKGAIQHSYPHCWRCKEPVITRATKQWFINIDHNGLREKALEAIEEVRWVPEIGKSRMGGMVQSRPDWCLSRQRYWGVPIPAFYCKNCGYEILDPEAIENVKRLVAKEGSDVWFIRDSKGLLPEGFKCPGCGEADFVKEEDILDVWFDSGVSHHAVLKKRRELSFPSELYLEGSDQHRGWFQTALLTSLGVSGEAPYKAVLTHGFVVDGEGRKMSKSMGNVISPQEIISKYGTDILRLWVAFSNYSDDIRISDQVLARTAEAYRKIRNTIKFILGNLYDFDPDTDGVEFSARLEIDRWVVSKAHSAVKKVTALYETFEFYKIYRLIYNFCITELSSFYLDILKDRLYTFGRASRDRRSAQSSLYEILLILEKLIAPILVFTAEEAWRNSKVKEKVESVHISSWPEPDEKLIDLKLEEKWDRLIDIRMFILKAIEEKRMEGKIGSSLEARVELAAKDNAIYSFLDGYKKDLPAILIVSEVELARAQDVPAGFSKHEEIPGLRISVGKASGQKCNRCWNYSSTVGESHGHPNLCERCVGVVDER